MSAHLKQLIAEIESYPGTVLVGVSKSVGPREVQAAYQYGITHFGENRVQDALEKIKECNLALKWHMVGRLQTNKLRKAAGKFYLIHSLCSIKLAVQASIVALAEGISYPFLIQVDNTDETSKQGLSLGEVGPFLQEVSELPGISIQGLMTIGPNTSDKARIEKCFREVRDLYEELGKCNLPKVDMRYLSMGMSADYQIALAAGSNMVRVGSAVFGNLK